MSRVQLALNVADLDASVAFYSTLFATAPHKRRPGYANFAIADPPLKLVLIEVSSQTRGVGTVGALNHLGVEVESAAEVEASILRLGADGLDTVQEKNTTCCYAVQDKVWVSDPAGAPWEVYTVTNDDPRVAASSAAGLLDRTNDGSCCTGGGDAAATGPAMPATAGACC
jgi:catechol 2,3-dioxygenase-like lactoylglutathione lyase family enzyme